MHRIVQHLVERDFLSVEMEDVEPGLPARRIDHSTVRFETYGIDDLQFPNGRIPDLSLFGRYKLIVYHTDLGPGPGLFRSGPLDGHLEAYVKNGGKLWITGKNSAALMQREPFRDQPNLEYPLAYGAGDFGYFRHLLSQKWPW